MMGRTHAAGGAVALIGAALLTHQEAVVPVWCYGLAAITALVPDADNGRGSIINRFPLVVTKWLTLPLWYGARHRGRTHSLLGLALFAAILGLYVGGLEWLSGGRLGLPVLWVMAAGLIGYASHLFLDMFNLEPVPLLWPLPFKFNIPPFRRLRFAANSFRSNVLLSGALSMVLGWYVVQHAPDLAKAGLGDQTIPNAARWSVDLFHRLIVALRGS